MENKDTTPATEAPAVAPSSDSCDRLQAARDYAAVQYEKIRKAAMAQYDQVCHYTEDARRQLNKGWDDTCTKAKDIHKVGEDYVRSNPTYSVLGALGVGLILGLLMGSSRR